MTEKTPAEEVECGEGGASRNEPRLDDESNVDEYLGLDRYISSLRRSRQLFIASGSDDEGLEEKDIPWWAPWRQLCKKKRDSEESSDEKNLFSILDKWLDTDMHNGLSENDIESRRKKIGWNELTAEKEKLFLKFLGYF